MDKVRLDSCRLSVGWQERGITGKLRRMGLTYSRASRRRSCHLQSCAKLSFLLRDNDAKQRAIPKNMDTTLDLNSFKKKSADRE